MCALFVKTIFILSTYGSRVTVRRIVCEKCVKILSSVPQSAMYNFRLQIGTYAMLGGPLHLQLSFSISKAVQRYPFRKLQFCPHF